MSVRKPDTDIELTADEAAVLASVRQKARVRQQRIDALAAANAVEAAAAPQVRMPASLVAAAKKHGVDLDNVGTFDNEQCEVCTGRSIIDEVALAFVGTLCELHAAAVVAQVCESILRPIIPGDLHEAKPSTLRAELAEWTPAVGGLYLYGDVGVGKSYDAAALLKLAWAWLRKQHERLPRVAWVNVPQMMDDIAATFNKDVAEYDMRRLREADVLVLDDIGMADNMAFAVRKLYVLLEHRLHQGLVTIVASNKNLDQLARHLDSPQIASRLSQMCAQVSYEGLPDRRPDKAPRLGT